MNVILLFLLMFINVGFANVSFSSGYGMSSYDVPIVNDSNGFSHNIFVSVDKLYSLNQRNQIVLSNVLSTNRGQSSLFLTEFELQTSFQRQLTDVEFIGVGFNVSYLINENIKSVDLVGTGIGINFKYRRELSERISFNIQLHTIAYDVLNASSVNNHTFVNKTVRTFFTYSPHVSIF